MISVSFKNKIIYIFYSYICIYFVNEESMFYQKGKQQDYFI